VRILYDVCPVRIDLHHQLLAWRGELGRPRAGARSTSASSLGPWGGRVVLARTWGLSHLRASWLRVLGPRIPNPWTRQRELPPMPRESFRAQWKKRVRPR